MLLKVLCNYKAGLWEVMLVTLLVLVSFAPMSSGTEQFVRAVNNNLQISVFQELCLDQYKLDTCIHVSPK